MKNICFGINEIYYILTKKKGVLKRKIYCILSKLLLYVHNNL